MESIKNATYLLCCIAVLTGGASMLLPDDRYKKVLSYILSLVFVLSIISAISGISFSVDNSLPAMTEIEYTQSLTANQAEHIVAAYLADNEIPVQKVLCNTDICDGKNIVITKADIYTNENEDVVKGLLKEAFGIQEVNVYDIK